MALPCCRQSSGQPVAETGHLIARQKSSDGDALPARSEPKALKTEFGMFVPMHPRPDRVESPLHRLALRVHLLQRDFKWADAHFLIGFGGRKIRAEGEIKQQNIEP